VAEEGKARLIGVLGKASDYAYESSISEGDNSVSAVSSSRISNETQSIVCGLCTYAS